MGPEYLRASSGTGPAVRATVSSDRLPTDMDVITDSVANWPAKGIATSGTPDDDGVIIPDTECVFYYVLSGTIIHITGFAPGYSDVGHTEGQIVILKPTTAWTDTAAEILEEGGGGSSVTIGDTPPADPGEGDLWGDTSPDNIDDIIVAIGSRLMPIGFIYVSSDATSPATVLGFGTWTRIEGRFIVAASDSDGDFDNGDTGGLKETNHAYIEPGLNSGRFQDTGSTYVGSVNSDIASWITAGGGSSHTSWSTVRGVGGSVRTNGTSNIEVRHARYKSNNLPPYIGKYVWERVG